MSNLSIIKYTMDYIKEYIDDKIKRSRIYKFRKKYDDLVHQTLLSKIDYERIEKRYNQLYKQYNNVLNDAEKAKQAHEDTLTDNINTVHYNITLIIWKSLEKNLEIWESLLNNAEKSKKELFECYEKNIYEQNQLFLELEKLTH